MTLVRWLSEIPPHDQTAGGKMARLADLARAGLEVPEAFVVIVGGLSDGRREL